MSDLDWLLFRQAGVLSRTQALQLFHPAMIQRRVASGVWERPANGVYVVDRTTDEADRLRWAAFLCAPAGAATAGRTALTQLGLRGFHVRAVHVLIPHRSRAPGGQPRVIFHRTRQLSAADIRHAASPPCTKPGRALLDAAQWARSDQEAITLVAAAFQQRLVSEREVRQTMRRMTKLRRRSILEQAVDDAVLGAHSLPEMEFLTLCRRNRLPVPVLQSGRRDHHGKQHYVDANFDKYRVIVEIDGQHHMDMHHWWADMQRQNLLQAAGERVLRFPSWAIRNKPDEVLDMLRRALCEAGWHG